MTILPLVGFLAEVIQPEDVALAKQIVSKHYYMTKEEKRHFEYIVEKLKNWRCPDELKAKGPGRPPQHIHIGARGDWDNLKITEKF